MPDYSKCHLCDNCIVSESPWGGRNEIGLAICHRCMKSGTTEGLAPDQEQRYLQFHKERGLNCDLARNDRGFAMLPIRLVEIVKSD